MNSYDYDLTVIGAGSGGMRASRIAAQMGARVAICEENRIGGTCVMRGCVPKKLLVYGMHFSDAFKDASGYGWTANEPTFSWSRLIAAKNREIDRLNKVYAHILRENNIDLLYGHGHIVDPHTVNVNGKIHTAKHILISTGSWPVMPDILGIKHAITSNEALDLLNLPHRIVIVGGGYIAVEFASIFNALGSKVTMIIRAEAPLRGFDEDLRIALSHEMKKRSIEIIDKHVVHSIEKTKNGAYSLHLSPKAFIETDVVMYATGRRPKTSGLGLQEVGVKLNQNGAVPVNKHYTTIVPSIHAVGDVTDRVNLTPVAIAEGVALANTLFNDKPSTVDYSNIPTAVFGQPPIGTVGLTEKEAKIQNNAVNIYVSSFIPMKHTLSGRNEKTFMKLVVDRKTDRVLGCHMIGLDAPEIIQGLAIALKCNATKTQFNATIGIHPSTAEEFVTMRKIRPDCNE